MSDDDGRATGRELGHSLLNGLLGLVVQGRGCLVKNQDRRVLQEHAGDRHALLLTTRKVAAALPYLGVVALGQPLDEVRDVRAASGLANLLGRGRGLAVRNVLGNGAVKQIHILLHKANRLAQALLRDVAHVNAVDADRTTGHIIKTRQQRTGCGLAATRRANQRNGLTGINRQIKPAQDFLLSVIREVHVAILNLATLDADVRRGRLVLDIRGGLDDFDKALETGNRLLEGLGKVQDVQDRSGEHRDIQCVGGQVHGLHLALGDHPTAQDDHDGVKRTHHSGNGSLVAAHGSVHLGLGLEISIVAGGKLRALQVLGRKRLDHARTGQRVLKPRVDGRDTHAVLAKDSAHAVVGPGVVGNQKRSYEGQHQRKRHVDRSQDDHRAHDLDHTNDQELRPVVRRLADVKKVRDQTAHQVARLVAVVKRETHALIGVKQVLAHAALHAGAHDVAPKDHEVAAGKAHQVHDDKTGAHKAQRGENLVGPLREKPLGHVAQNLRKGQVNTRNRKRADGVQDKQVRLARVVRQKGREQGALALLLGHARNPCGRAARRSSRSAVVLLLTKPAPRQAAQVVYVRLYGAAKR